MPEQPAPEAVEAVVEAMSAKLHITSDRWSPQQYRPALSADTSSVQIAGEAALAFIRDTIHRDGADADAIRQALGLRVQQREYNDGGPVDSVSGIERRLVGEWQTVISQPA